MTDFDSISANLDNAEGVCITEDGEIVSTTNVIETPNGPINKDSGKPATRLKPQKWYAWYDNNKIRLVSESEAMKQRFPGFTLRRIDTDLVWIGHVTPRHGMTTYKIAISYPDDFPSSAPKAYVLDPKIDPPKHVYSDKSLCLMYPGDKTWNPKITAVQIVTMAATWLFCYDYHQEHCPTRCGKVPCAYWPGEEQPH